MPSLILIGHSKTVVLTGLFCVLAMVFVESAVAQTATTAPSDSSAKTAPAKMDAAVYKKTVDAGIRFLLEKGQNRDDGSFSSHISPAVTSLCISALVQNGVPKDHPQIQQALKYVEKLVKPDGGIYAKGSNLRNYETSVSIICFNQVNSDNRYDEIIANATDFLKGIQWDETEGYQQSSNFYGGQGYGSHKRPDASNTSFFIDALQEVSPDGNSEALRKATIFMSRCQNLPSQHNSAEFARVASSEDKGGFIYSAVGKGESKAEPNSDTPQGGLRSYASMTYAGLKSFLYAGLDRDDVRVKAALDWIGRHYDLNSNPGVGQQGLFYYYHVFAKALKAYGEDTIVDAEGKSHDWRSDLLTQLSAKQQDDGSWTNPADRWYEGDPNLVTSYSLLSLSYCK